MVIAENSESERSQSGQNTSKERLLGLHSAKEHGRDKHLISLAEFSFQGIECQLFCHLKGKQWQNEDCSMRTELTNCSNRRTLWTDRFPRTPLQITERTRITHKFTPHRVCSQQGCKIVIFSSLRALEYEWEFFFKNMRLWKSYNNANWEMLI